MLSAVDPNRHPTREHSYFTDYTDQISDFTDRNMKRGTDEPAHCSDP